MLERRVEPRMPCTDKVNVEWTDRSGRVRRALASLDNISRSGACLVLACPIPPKSSVLITHPRHEVRGTIRYCAARSFGYVLGVRFDSASSWFSEPYRPAYFDPQRLTARAIDRLSSLRNDATGHGGSGRQTGL